MIFQDFVRYDLVLKENIAVGNIERVADEPAIRSGRRPPSLKTPMIGGMRGWFR